MKYQVNVKGVPPALAKKMSAVISAEVNKVEAEVSKWNAMVARERNQATVMQAVQEVMNSRNGRN